jgi:hypothetical protein
MCPKRRKNVEMGHMNNKYVTVVKGKLENRSLKPASDPNKNLIAQIMIRIPNPDPDAL